MLANCVCWPSQPDTDVGSSGGYCTLMASNSASVHSWTNRFPTFLPHAAGFRPNPGKSFSLILRLFAMKSKIISAKIVLLLSLAVPGIVQAAIGTNTDLAIGKSASRPSAFVGNLVQFNIGLTNLG